MKSGRIIFYRLRACTRPAKRVRRLGNGDLRSLIKYLSKPEFDDDAQTNQILGLAMIEVVRRFVKGRLVKGVIL